MASSTIRTVSKRGKCKTVCVFTKTTIVYIYTIGYLRVCLSRAQSFNAFFLLVIGMVELSWQQYHADILLLKERLGNYRPDVIVPCMLGGLIPGAILAKFLGIADVRPIDIERKGTERRLAYDVQGSVAGKKMLVVEDDLPTGIGPAIIKKQFEQRGAEVKIAAIYITQASKPLADFFVREFERPPDYPWKKGHVGDRLRQ